MFITRLLILPESIVRHLSEVVASEIITIVIHLLGDCTEIQEKGKIPRFIFYAYSKDQ